MQEPSIPRNARIFVAGHRGMAGSAIVRNLRAKGYENLICRTHAELDLTDQAQVRSFFGREKPEYVFLAAAKVGGIHANDTYRAEFIRENLAIQTSVIHEAWSSGVKRLLFLGSSCIYPRDCPQPMREEYLLTGPLELTNRPYALAKIAGIEMCWAYNRQYGTRYLAVMPTNLYGISDNYHPENSHVLPALIRRVHETREQGHPELVVWGTGAPLREFLYADDMADACVFLMNLPEDQYAGALGNDLREPPLVNIGSGQEISIRELAETVCRVVGYGGNLVFDSGKPDGTPRKLLDSGKLAGLGWRSHTPLAEGIQRAYADFLEREMA